MKYRLYVDEVGNSDLKSSLNLNHRFLSLTGIILDLEYVRIKLFSELESLKTTFFESHPDNPVILHRKEILNARPPFDALLDSNIRADFDAKLLRYLNEWDYTVITVCLDKRKHMQTYTTWRYDPYHYCLALLLERYVIFLSDLGRQGDVMAESRGGREDRRLKSSFSGIWNNGTNFLEANRFQSSLTSKELKIKPKANNISGLQLADLLAHPSRNEILTENGITGIRLAPFARKIISILSRKYYRKDDNIYGKKFL